MSADDPIPGYETVWTVRADQIEVGQCIKIGGSNRNGWKPQAMDVHAIESHEKDYPEGIVFVSSEGKRIFRWDANLIEVIRPT